MEHWELVCDKFLCNTKDGRGESGTELQTRRKNA